MAKVGATVAITMMSASYRDRASAHQTQRGVCVCVCLTVNHKHITPLGWAEPQPPAFRLQPARHYDDSVAYQCLPQIYLSLAQDGSRAKPGACPSAGFHWRPGAAVDAASLPVKPGPIVSARSLGEHD